MIRLKPLLESTQPLRDVLIRRIPFLRDYTIYKHPRDPQRLEAQRMVYTKDHRIKMGDDIVTFPQWNISSEITYYPHRVDDYVFHNFIVKNAIHAMPPAAMSDLEQRVLMLSINQMSDRLSFRKEIRVPADETIPAEELDVVINAMNGALFRIEQYADTSGIALF